MQYAGYTKLIEDLDVLVPPLTRDLATGDSYKDEVLPHGYNDILVLKKTKTVGPTLCDHIGLAIEMQGIRPAYLYPIFQKISEDELVAYISDKPQSTIRRCIWHLYEWLLDIKLPIADLTSGNYTPLLDDKYYFTSLKGVKDPRTKVIHNMLGTKEFSPMIRKTSKVKGMIGIDLIDEATERLRTLHHKVDADTIGRSIQYLYTKETKSSFEIENETPDKKRNSRFYQALQTSGTLPLSKKRLLHLQNQIVEGKKIDADYRDVEIHVGNVIADKHEGLLNIVDFIGPIHERVPSLMNGLIETHRKILTENDLPPIMHAALIAFGFVYIHPFNDGNGRIHRFLFHDILRCRSDKNEIIIPVSATILQNINQYYDVLNSFSKPLMALLSDYDIDDETYELRVPQDLHYLYRYLDLTEHVEFLFDMMTTSIHNDLVDEAIFILKFDAVKKAIKSHVDLPNQKADLICKFILQNNGTVSGKKRNIPLEYMSEETLTDIEDAVHVILMGFNDL